MVVIIDYGVGNIASVEKACKYIGRDVVLSKDKSVITAATHIILPGVGAFKDAMNALKESGLDSIIKSAVDSSTPILGICLGMQVLASIGYEDGEFDGLSIIENSTVTRFDESKFNTDDKLKIPHIGWNNVRTTKDDCPLFKGIEKDSMFYFVHSYHINVLSEYIMTTTDYGYNFTSSVCKDNVYGVQFHPEKSSDVGLRLIENFCSL